LFIEHCDEVESMAEAPLPRLYRLLDLLDEWEKDAVLSHVAYTTGMARGPVTGHTTLDRELGGAFGEGVHVLHGGPGSGKTALALQTAESAGCPALYLSCEMGALELLRRLTARATGTFLGRLKSGEIEPEHSLALARRAAAAAPLLSIADATQAPARLDWLKQAAEIVRGQNRYLLIVVDSVHSWAEGLAADAGTEYEMLNAGLAALRQLSSGLGCAVIAVAERNRPSMRAGGLSAAAGTRKFEYAATTVLDLARDLDKPPDAAGEVPVTLTIAKNRNGAAGRKIELLFHGALQRFRERGSS
jgi:replicative DNA helicase